MEEIGTTTMTTFTAQIYQLISAKLTDIKHQLTMQIDQVLSAKLQDFELQLNMIIDEMIQDIYGASEDAHGSMTTFTESTLDDIYNKLRTKEQETLQDTADNLTKLREQTIAILPTNSGTTTTHNYMMPKLVSSTRFSHARVDYNFWCSPKTNDSANSQPDINPHCSIVLPHILHNKGISINDEPKNVPHSIHVNNNTLPPVNHDQAIFILYNQLMNAMEQFGIYLIPLSSVQYKISLCPTHHNGILIDDRRRHSMASTLCQKLQNTDVVPLEYTSIRNISN
jgi:hypothetical protein